ncbi:MAG TPA: SDR family oxidoreductase [Nitrospira sp.]|nr:SDR family oxidoreductase [Nitrospira sp.]
MTRILVTGAGGFLASHLIPALSHAGYDVICCGRDTASLQIRFPGCQVAECNFASCRGDDLWDGLLRDVSVVINAAGIIQQHGANTFEAVHRDGPIMLFHAAERAGVRRVIQISALGADTQAATLYHRTKWAADEELRGSTVEWVVLQPSLIYGCGGRSQAFFAALAAMPVLCLVGGGDQRIQPIHVEDVVEGILRLIHADAPSHLTLPVVGPEPITFRHFMEAIRRWLGLGIAPILTVPVGLVRLAARMGDVVRSDFVNSDTLVMLCRGNTADPAPYVAATGVRPRPLSLGLPERGAPRSELLSASLYFAPPVLRLSIALVWIGSGIVSLWWFPRETSEAWLLRTGIPAAWTALTLQITAILDILLGIATLIRWHLPAVLFLQLLLICGFTLILTVRMPEVWIHPFGPALKNLPLFVATWVLWVMERRR